jgi:glycosyltransferase involved in cell wall biosynthesis
MNFLSENHKVFVLTGKSFKGDNHKSEANPRIQVFPCPIKPILTLIPFMSILNVFFLYFYLHSFLQKMKVDVLLASIPEFEEGVACALLAKSSRTRFVIDIRDLIVEDHVEAVYPMFPKAFRKGIILILDRILFAAINSYDSAVTVTSTLKESLLAKGVKIPIDVIANGADTRLFHPVTPETKQQIRREMGLDGGFMVLYAGAMGVAYYPMDVVLRAFFSVNRSLPDAKLVLCGSWSKEVESLKSSIKGSVDYLGLLTLEEVARVMQACDVGVITMDDRPSTFVALTTKFFEYLASGLPVVAACPNGGELERLITSQKVGYAVIPGDYKSMSERITRLLGNETERQTLAKNGVQLVTTEFDRAKLAATFQDVLLQTND